MNQPATSNLIIEITSFSFKAPLPPNLFSLEGERHGGGFVFDCRSLPNPGREERFKAKTGLDADVAAYLEAAAEISAFRHHVFGLVDSAATNFLERGFTFMNVSFGCTGGQHRSVFFTEQLAQHVHATLAPRVSPRIIHYNLIQKGFIKG